jgi:glycine/D-amino acid oxidase-like deaminating enzyme
MVYDVVVLGGGIGGLSITNECALRGAMCCLIETDSVPSFSSVKNQGWLHSGALYAFHGAAVAARECYAASLKLKSLMEISSTKLSDLTGVAYFKDVEDARKMVSQSVACGIPSKILSSSDLSDVGRSLMDGPNHNFAVEIPDVPISNHAFLTYLSSIGKSRGVEHVVSETPFEEFQFVNDGTSWVIAFGNSEIRTRKIVLSCGPYIPTMMSNFPDQSVDFSVKNCYVMAAKAFETDRLYISPTKNTQFMNVSPYSDGTTLNCGGLDENAENMSSSVIRKHTIKHTLKQISKNWPAFTNRDPQIVTYVCQKLNVNNLPEEDRRRSFHRLVANDVFVFYPGKFTLALEGARSLADIMLEQKGLDLSASQVDFVSSSIKYVHPANANETSYKLSEIVRRQS